MTAPSDFVGPLDLLMDEVRRQNVAIENIAMGPIVARYLDYMQSAAERNLDLDAEWLLMAATLIQWKSRALLPRDPNQKDGADPIRDQIVQQLLAYKKEAAEDLDRRRTVQQNRFSRARIPVLPPPEAAEPAAHTVADLIQKARDTAAWVEQHRADRRFWKESAGSLENDVSVSEMADYLREKLDSGEALDGNRLMQNEPNSRRRCAMFLAMLEMARDGQVETQQTEAFGAIQLRRR